MLKMLTTDLVLEGSNLIKLYVPTASEMGEENGDRFIDILDDVSTQRTVQMRLRITAQLTDVDVII